MSIENDVLDRLRGMAKTARMWGSPEELECAAMHFTHVLFSSREAGWRLEQTFEKWKSLGAPFAGDADEHAVMRSKMWGADEAKARVQVVQGYVVVWAGLARRADREAVFTPWIEALIDGPQFAGTPDRLNMTLFALMGFVAADPQAYVHALNLERHRIGGHELRPLPVVAPPGPTDAGVTYTRNFTTWQAVIDGISKLIASLTA
ncbi:MAG: hypothetical protein DI536_33890 [Archangium gephyra]|uniref:Uncharacterized protein n=1 Tax=Archangium gephyra TaxID=48 RepID=A0A2W5SPS2_9BACT|nr:MAG: hypothetical protein DI536_33890 [Archangium gephyra]